MIAARYDLHRNSTGLERFQLVQSVIVLFRRRKVIAGPWLLATGDDFRYPETEGGRPDRITRMMHGYVDHVMYIANENPHVFLTFFEVAQLLKPPTAFFQPRIAAQVLARMIRQPRHTAGASDKGRKKGVNDECF